MLRLAFDFIITWRETRTRPNAYAAIVQTRSTFTPANRQPTLMKSNSGEPPTEPFSVRVSHCLS